MITWHIVEGSIVEPESKIAITNGITTDVLSLPPCVDEAGLRELAQGQCDLRDLELQAALQDSSHSRLS